MSRLSEHSFEAFKLRYFILFITFAFTTAIHAESITHIAPNRNLQAKQVDTKAMATKSMAQHNEALKKIMLTLYQLNPKQLRKSTQVSAEEMVQWTFEGPFNWKFDGVRRLQGTDALTLAADAHFPGDRVLALVAGLQTMLAKAYGGKTEYDFSGPINPQVLYNAARNVQIAVIKTKRFNDDLVLTDDDQSTDLTHQLSQLIQYVDLDANRLAAQKQQVIQLLGQESLQTVEWQAQ